MGYPERGGGPLRKGGVPTLEETMTSYKAFFEKSKKKSGTSPPALFSAWFL